MELHLPVAIGLMVAALLLAIGAKRAHLPYNVALVVGGLLITLSEALPETPHLEPEVVFLLCLPALLFEGGFTADLDSIRANLLPISLLATAGLLVAIGATGAFLHLGLGLPWGPAFLLGSILSVTDTVSILFAFRRAPVPGRLSAIVLGESLFNDGTALVAYAAISGIVAGAPFAIPVLGARVVIATAGGLAVGLALGLVGSWILRRAEDPLAEIMATTALAFAAFVGAEELRVSGAIAAVAAGLTVGATARKTLSPTSQVALHSFWEYVAFGVNTFLFLSVGLSTSPSTLLSSAPQTAIAVACVFAGRAVAIYLPFLVLRWLRPSQAVPLQWQHVFVIGNIKGALSIALVLGLPKDTPFRTLLVDVAFGVTFISLVVQGLLLGKALDWLGLTRRDPLASAVAEQQAKLVAARAAHGELEALLSNGMVPRMAYERLRSEYQVTIAEAEREIRRLQDRNLARSARLLLTVRRRLVDAERSAVGAAERTGLIDPEAAERYLHRLDERTLALEHLLQEGVELDVHGDREGAAS
ncbi:MAG TPA: sodium:proton antiporter [Myxococcaceae bacterium]|nr:sodium:proton antiporter [Myxococcaceae bacterium]